MIKIEPFQSWHIAEIDAQESQSGLVDDESAKAVSMHQAWTATLDGKVIACCGIVPIWKGRSMMWSQISKTISPKGMILLTRAVKRVFDLNSDRLEAFIADGHEAGHRWIKMLGFTLDTPMPMEKVLPNGEDAYLYSRVH